MGKDTFLLPCLGHTELDVQQSGAQSVTVEDSMSMVHASRGTLPPASPHLKSEPAIVAGIAKATLRNNTTAIGIIWWPTTTGFEMLSKRCFPSSPITTRR
ncbi:MAG TPA: hypothetical protein VFP68_15190 [Burkholderiaceae bacterium]|nr:hypothetical protein [Burkholderiaceae bacterium]